MRVAAILLTPLDLDHRQTRRSTVEKLVRYFMHMCDGGGFVEDTEGCELADDAAARDAAILAARDVMAGDLRDGRLDLTSFIEVEDEAHRLLFTITFADVVTMISTSSPTRRQRPE
jgi:hypothetical protein